ncbi:Centrin [Hexamita inflata]|uniref:Centrin n=1 Tax=Hexamita inflata TaxID=28002 RepID=A0AA86UBI5_9EUKA|nr:Centrin [Hexamita inflata]CAI9949089.1 Centrin [Hexamita inflata]CAI9958882.1 Centrin [Hexamita inflata]
MSKFSLTKTQQTEISDAFMIFDTEKSGHLSKEQFKLATRALGFELSKEDFAQLAGQYASDQGYNFEDFQLIVSEKMQCRDLLADLSTSFKQMAPNGQLKISSLREVCKQLNELQEDEDFQQMISIIDQDGKGYVTENQYLKFMMSGK